MVSTESAVAPLLGRTGGWDVATRNQAGFERLAALFELSEQRTAIALVSTYGLAGLPGLAGELARRWNLAPIDLTRDEDPYADLDTLPRGRVLVGMSLLSPARMQDCLTRLNRGRDRIHALGLHVVLLIDDADARAVYEHAPDFASRVHESVEFDGEVFEPARTGLLSPLGPIRRGDVECPAELLDELRAVGRRVPLPAHANWASWTVAAALGWSMAENTHTRVAWLECGRWDAERTQRWLGELGPTRARVTFGDVDHRFAEPGELSSVLACQAMLESDDSRVELLPELHVRSLGEVLHVLAIVGRSDEATSVPIHPPVDVHISRNPSVSELVEVLDTRPFQIVHVIGHQFDFSEQELAWALGSHAVAVCVRDAGKPEPSYANALIRSRIGSVLDAGFWPSADSRSMFFLRVYDGVARGETVAQAVRSAKLLIHRTGFADDLRLTESTTESQALVRPPLTVDDQTS